MPKRLIRYIVAIYPSHIQKRYGDDIAELLATSQRPARDLADVARCALVDRVTSKPESAATTRTPSRSLAIVKLLLAPMGLQMLNLAFLALLLAGLAALRYSVEVTRLLSGMLAGLVVVLVFWFARRAGRKWAIASRGVVVPATMAVGLLIWWLITPVAVAGVQLLPKALICAVPLIGTWCAGTMALNAATARLRQRVSGWAAGLILTLGGFVVMELCTIVHVLIHRDAQTAPARDALLWYPMRLVGYNMGNALGYQDTLADVARGPEALLTLCTVFALSLVTASRHRETVAVQRFRGILSN